MIQLPPEKLGSFFLGAKYDIENKSLTEEAINYDARDLTTHAVCVGMTGSGKTGLCIGLLEEAAIDKVPALIIDPKGDMTNLLLQFSDLSPADFEKWINADDAGRKGMTPTEYATSMAGKWKDGLASWGQGLERIKLLKDSVDYTIYTPGSDAGIPINIMGSFAAPGVDFDENAEMLRERIQGTVAALLGMIENNEDPVRSREGILLSTIFEHYWRNGEDLDLATIIRSIQKPPIKQLGVFEVDTFYPEKDRFQLAMDFNTLMASPQFSYWLQGEALDIEKLYFTPEGKPKHSIFYIAHLSESERMFFVTLLLNSLITWMRRQSGTTSLRSLLYFDEIFGYFPPTANPPSKKPLLTILKQARAFGVGAVLVTQNPVDIDYKGLSNAGTWFIGKLQTERDKQRVLDGLEGAIAEAGNNAKTDFSQMITSLGSRVFLLHNVHQDEPVVFNTRWVMSYLRGPMTRPQIKQLMKAKKEVKKEQTTVMPPKTVITQNEPAKVEPVKQAVVAPSIDPKIPLRFFAAWKSMKEAQRQLGTQQVLSLSYQPEIVATAKVRYYDSKREVDQIENIAYSSSAPNDFGGVNWNEAIALAHWKNNLIEQPNHDEGIEIQYQAVPDNLNSAKDIGAVEDNFADWLYANKKHIIHEHVKLELYQKAEESIESFKMRVQQKARELRDEELDELQDKYEDKLDKIDDKIRKEEQDLERAKDEKRDRKREETVKIAETIFSVFVKGRSRSFSSSATKSRMRRKAAQKVEAAKEDLENAEMDYEEMEEELKEKIQDITKEWEEVAEGITTREVNPRRTDVKVENVIFTWHPYWVSLSGNKVSANL